MLYFPALSSTLAVSAALFCEVAARPSGTRRQPTPSLPFNAANPGATPAVGSSVHSKILALITFALDSTLLEVHAGRSLSSHSRLNFLHSLQTLQFCFPAV